jgi:DNA-binding transcriptional ArsR family regulator
MPISRAARPSQPFRLPLFVPSVPFVLSVPSLTRGARHTIVVDDPEYFDNCRNTELPSVDSLFKAFNDPTRRRILELLRVRSLTAGEIADACSVGKPTISHHLDLLMRAELIEQEKEGQFRRYHLNTSVMEDLMLWLGKLVAPAARSGKSAKTSPRKHLKPRHP